MKGQGDGAVDVRWIVGGFLATLLAVGYFFQRPDSWRKAVLDAGDGAASLAYLRGMIATDPGDLDLRLKLARELAKAEEWEQAYTALTPVLRSADGLNPEVWLERLRIRQMELYGLAEKDSRRETLKGTLIGELEELIGTLPGTQGLAELAQVALQLERPELAAKAYEQLARRGPREKMADWLRETGRWYLAAAQPMQAASALHEAVTWSTQLQDAEAAAVEELEALRAGEAGQQALDVSAVYVERFRWSRRLLEAAIANARAESATQQAYAWARLRLDLDPDDPLWEDRLRRLALDAGDLEEALTMTHRLVQRDPSSPEHRRDLAEIAEWADRPAVALPNWIWLANHDPDGPGVARGLPLAIALHNDQAIIRLLELASERRALEKAELEELTQSCIRSSALARGSELLGHYLERHGDQAAAWKALAELSERQGDVSGAVKAWQHAASDSSVRVFATMRAADLLWRSDERDAAWDVLSALRPSPDVKERDYWRMVADQAWELEHRDRAVAAYGLLWANGSKEQLVAERLILLTQQTTSAGEAITLAEEAFRRLGEPRLLSLGIDVALQRKRLEDLRRLLDTADRARARFPQLASYWLQLASLEQGSGQAQRARSAYEKVLELDPKSIDAKAALFWSAIDGGDSQRLESLLSRWQADALTSPELWKPYAVGLAKLGANDRAVAWFQRRAERQPRDSDALLDYAESLAKVGRDREALEIRKEALERLREKLPNPSLGID